MPGTDKATMVHAPYNFVPLSPHVWFPGWGVSVSHDVPFKEGLCGTLEYEIEATTPIFVRGHDNSAFRTPDGRFAIPGSSVRGMLRNVVEIAAFGKLSRVNAFRYGVRDLQNRDLYTSHMAEIRNGQPVPLVDAGWLTRERRDGDDDPAADPDTVVAKIAPTSFAKIEYDRLKILASSRSVLGFDPNRRQGATDKYKAWGSASREVTVAVQTLTSAGAHGRLGDFGVVYDGSPTHTATLVFTGQPQDRGEGDKHKKHHDFVFYRGACEGNALDVPKRTFADFEFVHRGSGQQGRAEDHPNDEWEYWKQDFDRGIPVPVFFLRNEDGSVRAFGLAMMFRLANRLTTKDVVRNAQPEHEDPRSDLSDLLFGFVRDRRTGKGGDSSEFDGALRGRVSIGLASLQGPPKSEAPARVILGSPKPSYYPNYLEQPGPTDEYWTYMDAGAKARGWKRYRPHRSPVAPLLPARVNERQITDLRPLTSGSRFTGRIRFHNVLPKELGALLWAMDFGSDSTLRHTLGSARSLGYGSAVLRVTRDDDVRSMGGEPVPIDQCRKAFVDAAEDWAAGKQIPGGWSGSAQISHLKACAKPMDDGDANRKHMQLSSKEFTEAKAVHAWLLPAASPEACRAAESQAATRRRAEIGPRGRIRWDFASAPTAGVEGAKYLLELHGRLKGGVPSEDTETADVWKAELRAHFAKALEWVRQQDPSVIQSEVTRLESSVQERAGGRPPRRAGGDRDRYDRETEKMERQLTQAQARLNNATAPAARYAPVRNWLGVDRPPPPPP